MEPWRVDRPVVADSHQFDGQKDPDPEPLQSEKSHPERLKIKVKRRNRIRMDVLQIPNLRKKLLCSFVAMFCSFLTPL
jgi:hypothetical protein